MPFSPGIFSNIYRNCTILRKRAEKAAEKNRYFPPLWVYRFFTGLLSPISSLKFALFNQELNYFAVVSMPHMLFVYSMHKKAFRFTAKRLSTSILVKTSCKLLLPLYAYRARHVPRRAGRFAIAARCSASLSRTSLPLIYT